MNFFSIVQATILHSICKCWSSSWRFNPLFENKNCSWITLVFFSNKRPNVIYCFIRWSFCGKKILYMLQKSSFFLKLLNFFNDCFQVSRTQNRTQPNSVYACLSVDVSAIKSQLFESQFSFQFLVIFMNSHAIFRLCTFFQPFHLEKVVFFCNFLYILNTFALEKNQLCSDCYQIYNVFFFFSTFCTKMCTTVFPNSECFIRFNR